MSRRFDAEEDTRTKEDETDRSKKKRRKKKENEGETRGIFVEWTSGHASQGKKATGGNRKEKVVAREKLLLPRVTTSGEGSCTWRGSC